MSNKKFDSSTKDWLDNIANKTTPLWMIKTLKIED